MPEKLIYGNDGNRWPETPQPETAQDNSWAETLAKMQARVEEAKAEAKKYKEIDQALKEFAETHKPQVSKKGMQRALAGEIQVLNGKIGDMKKQLEQKDILVDLAELRVRDIRRELDKARAIINAYKSRFGSL